MTKAAKRLQKIRNNPKSVRYKELAKVLEDLGYSQRAGSGGSHSIFINHKGDILTVVKPHGKGESVCAERDVKDVLQILDLDAADNGKD